MPKVRQLAVGVAALLWVAPPLDAARRPAPSAFELFPTFARGLEGNRVYCGFRAIGEFCVDVTGSPVLGGGSWPRSSGNQFIFNSGLQIAALVPASAGFAWAGDTVGSWFMDPRGDQQSGSAVTSIFDSRYQDYQPRRDFADWPGAAFVRDTALFATALIGREAVSNHDTWVRYWDGDPRQTAGRGHPMGVLVEQRTLQWNYPNGNDDIVYRIYRIINVTASDPAAYTGLASFGYSATDIGDLAALGAQYRSEMQRAFGVTIPAAGYPFTQTFLSWYTDWDVGTVVGDNYSTAVLPFGVATGYVADFQEPFWSFPAEIHAPPLSAAPGFAGQAFLRTPGGPPETRGIHIWSNTTGGGAYPDAVGIGMQYRMMQGTTGPPNADPVCPTANPQQRHVCFQSQFRSDTRGYMSSGPFTLAPGAAVTLVMALVMAAPVHDAILPYIGQFPGLPPGFPPHPAGLALPGGGPDNDTVRVIDRAMGWMSHSDVNGDGLIAMNEVTTVPRSLLWKTQLAEAVVASRFQMPAAPEEPGFFVVPGDDQVTVVWRPSATEAMGDPYFNVASNPATPLYDPNYRRFDVEGYRVWRGTSPASMQLVAQFDYKQTSFVDYTALVTATYWYPVRGMQCAPELGLLTDCGTLPDTIPLANDLVQVRSGERGLLANGALTVFRADTAFGGRGLPRLTDGGVPFAFIDTTVRNGQTYYYAVTAFDVNSFQSGPSSMESARTPKAVRPRVSSGQESGGGIAVQLVGGDGTPLDLTAVMPPVDSVTGVFAGPLPPANGLALTASAFVPQLVEAETLTVVVDSVLPGSSLVSIAPTRYYLRRLSSSAPPVALVLSITPYGFDGDNVTTVATALTTPVDGARASRFGGDSTYVIGASLALRLGGVYGLTQKGRAWANAHPDGAQNGPRWWQGTARVSPVLDPNGINCKQQIGSFNCVLGNLARHAGQIPGVDLFVPMSYLTVSGTTPARNWEAITSTVMRAAEIRVHWGGGGTIDSVVDVTHRVRVPFNARIGPSWGFLNDLSFGAVTASATADGDNGKLSWSDVACIAPIHTMLTLCGGGSSGTATLMTAARLSPVVYASGTYAGTASQPSNGNGFIMYLNGWFTLFRMNALPAAGTVWTMQSYAGNIAGSAGSYAYSTQTEPPRPAAVPGLRLQLVMTGSTFDPSVTRADDLARVHTVPDPYYVSHALETTENRQLLRFVNVPAQSVIRIYSTSGILVRILTNNDVTGGGEMEWDVRNRTGTRVASGVYFWHLETPDGRKRIGRFAVVNGAR